MLYEFQGHSDDVFQVNAAGETSGIEASGKDGIKRFVIVDPEPNGLILVAAYSMGSDYGTWFIGVQQLEEDKPIPKGWIYKITTARSGYSPLFILDLPPGTMISNGLDSITVPNKFDF